MVNKYIFKLCSQEIGELQIKTTVWYYFTPIVLAAVFKMYTVSPGWKKEWELLMEI